MLQELSIQNFAIIPKLTVSFEPGMTVLTGETGAGKSIIIDAVGLLTGGRGSQDYIREGTDKAVLQGLITVTDNPKLIQVLAEYGIELEEQQLLIHRELHRSGRNVIRVNGTLVNASALKAIGRYLVDIHGQNEHQELMQVERHRHLLDAADQATLAPLLADYAVAYADYRHLAKQYQERKANEHEWAQRFDMLNFQLNELQAADLQDGEEAELEAEYQELSNFQDVLEASSKAYELLDGDWEGNGLATVGDALSALEDIEDLSPKYAQLTETLRDVFYRLQEATTDISAARDQLSFDDERLAYVDDRLNLIRTLEQKYGATIADVLAHQSRVEQELMAMGGGAQSAEALAESVKAAKSKAQDLADKLTTARETVATTLADKIHEQLRDLYMEKAVFSVRITPTTALTATGQDEVEFYIQTNPGEGAKPLVKVASGGELSRMMLAMKMIFSQEQGVTSIVFDEVDTGVSGRVAQAIAEKIADIGQHSQVLTITHLPQVAAVADQHFFIQKQVIDERTETTVAPLAPEQRIDELARMLSGNELTDAARENARDLLAREAKRKKST